MRRADRLFRIIQLLRNRRFATAGYLADKLEVSERTVYRDIRDLVGSGIPIEGEAGVGYALPDGYELPPLSFTTDEIEALVLGLRVVEKWADSELVQGARSILDKVEAVLPESAKPRMNASALFLVRFGRSSDIGDRLGLLRRAVSDYHKFQFRYRRADGERTERTVRPICLTLMMSAWLLCAWCEQRNDYRTFRLDRMTDLRALSESFEADSKSSLEGFMDALGKRMQTNGQDGARA